MSFRGLRCRWVSPIRRLRVLSVVFPGARLAGRDRLRVRAASFFVARLPHPLRRCLVVWLLWFAERPIASACRFLIEGRGDDLGLEPPPGADIYLFSGAPVERRSWRAEGQRPFAPVPTAVGA